VGYLVSVECKNTFYQGVIDVLDVANNVLRLKKCYANGMNCGTNLVEIKNDEIDNIEIIADASNATKYLMSEKSASSSTINGKNHSQSQPQIHQASTNGNGNSNSNKRATKWSPKLSNGSSSASSYEHPPSDLNEACFNQSSCNDDSLTGDFDFEKNLALFDKHAFSQTISNPAGSMKPSASAHALDAPKTIYQPLSIENLFSFHSNLNRQQATHANGDATKPLRSSASHRNYRCDEMILDTGEPVVLAQIQVPCASTKHYVTDDGLIVPSITRELRASLFEQSLKEGFGKSRLVECMGKCCCEMALLLLGGPIRFHPKNRHQKPRVLVMANAGEMQGAYALSLARLLSSRNVFVFVYLHEADGGERQLVEAEMRLLRLTDARLCATVEEMSSEPPLDLIVNGLDSAVSARNSAMGSQLAFRSLLKFVATCKASVLSIDPPMEGSVIEAKWSVVPVLPQAMSPNCGRLYLCDLGFSRKLFEMVAIKYQSPFGAKFLIPLHND